MKKIIYVSILLFLCSCGHKEVWMMAGKTDAGCGNTITIQGKSIRAKLCFANETDEKFVPKEITYSIVEEINNDKNDALVLYLLKNEDDNTFTCLPELKVDEHTRKFDTQTLTSFKYKEAELRAYLFDSTFSDGKGNKFKGMYFASTSAVSGNEYKKAE